MTFCSLFLSQVGKVCFVNQFSLIKGIEISRELQVQNRVSFFRKLINIHDYWLKILQFRLQGNRELHYQDREGFGEVSLVWSIKIHQYQVLAEGFGILAAPSLTKLSTLCSPHVGGAVRVVELRWKHILKVAALSFAEASQLLDIPIKKIESVWGATMGRAKTRPLGHVN